MISDAALRKIKEEAARRGLPPETLIDRWVEGNETPPPEEEEDRPPPASQLVDRVKDKILLLDPGHRIRYVNQRLADMLGIDPEQPVGLPLGRLGDGELLSAEATESITRAASRVRSEEIAEERVEVPVQIGGEEAPRRWEIRISQLGPGREAVILVARDETERAAVERELREQQARFRGIAHSIPGVVYQFVARPDGRYENTFISEHAREVLGLDPDPEGFYERFLERVPTSHREKLVGSIDEAVEQETRWSFEMPFTKPSGKRIWLQGISMPDRRGEELFFNGVLLEITRKKAHERELIAAKEEARQASRMKSALLENMSHELRTPLASVIGFADLLLAECEEPIRGFAERIRMSGNRLLDTLEAVLNLAELEGEDSSLEPREIDAAEILRRASEALEPEAQRKGLSLRTHGIEEPVPATTDPSVLSRITTHLLSNGIKFTKEGSVSVVLEATADELIVAVEDTGIGIPEASKEEIFEPFVQASSGLDREYEGTGLGLTITRRLAEMAGGTIAVESLESGTRVRVRLPRDLSERESYEPTSPAYGWGLDQLPDSQQILLVEDDAGMRELVREMLPETVDLTEAEDPEKALARIRAESFDLILLDINLKASLNGVDLLGRIREEVEPPGPLVIALTAYATGGDEEAFREAGFDGYVAKPFTRETLRTNLIQVIEDAGSAPASEGEDA